MQKLSVQWLLETQRSIWLEKVCSCEYSRSSKEVRLTFQEPIRSIQVEWRFQKHSLHFRSDILLRGVLKLLVGCSKLYLVVSFAEAGEVIIFSELHLGIKHAVGSPWQNGVPSVQLLLLEESLRRQIQIAVVKVKTISRASIQPAIDGRILNTRT